MGAETGASGSAPMMARRIHPCNRGVNSETVCAQDPDEPELNAIQHAWNDQKIVQPAIGAIDGSSAIAQQLFEYLGEMARRNDVAIPLDISREIHAILAIELAANVEDLKARPDQLIAATVQQGVLELHKNQTLMNHFFDNPSIFKYAAATHKDPAVFLAGVIDKAEELSKDQRFSSLLDTPGIFKFAAAEYKDPVRFLASVIKKVEELSKDERFSSLLDSPSILKRAAV